MMKFIKVKINYLIIIQPKLLLIYDCNSCDEILRTASANEISKFFKEKSKFTKFMILHDDISHQSKQIKKIPDKINIFEKQLWIKGLKSNLNEKFYKIITLSKEFLQCACISTKFSSLFDEIIKLNPFIINISLSTFIEMDMIINFIPQESRKNKLILATISTNQTESKHILFYNDKLYVDRLITTTDDFLQTYNSDHNIKDTIQYARQLLGIEYISDDMVKNMIFLNISTQSLYEEMNTISLDRIKEHYGFTSNNHDYISNIAEYFIKFYKNLPSQYNLQSAYSLISKFKLYIFGVFSFISIIFLFFVILDIHSMQKYLEDKEYELSKISSNNICLEKEIKLKAKEIKILIKYIASDISVIKKLVHNISLALDHQLDIEKLKIINEDGKWIIKIRLFCNEIAFNAFLSKLSNKYQNIVIDKDRLSSQNSCDNPDAKHLMITINNVDKV